LWQFWFVVSSPCVSVAMKIVCFDWQSADTASAVPVEDPPVTITAPSRSIMRCALSRATSALVWSSPTVETTFIPMMPPLLLTWSIARS
jgi:hypothetical protein